MRLHMDVFGAVAGESGGSGIGRPGRSSMESACLTGMGKDLKFCLGMTVRLPGPD